MNEPIAVFNGQPAIRNPNLYITGEVNTLLNTQTLPAYIGLLEKILNELEAHEKSHPKAPLAPSLKVFEHAYSLLDLQTVYLNYQQQPGLEWLVRKLVSVHQCFMEVTAPYRSLVGYIRESSALQSHGVRLLLAAHPAGQVQSQHLALHHITKTLPTLEQLGGPHAD